MAEAFFSDDLIDISLGAGLDDVQMALDETMSGGDLRFQRGLRLRSNRNRKSPGHGGVIRLIGIRLDQARAITLLTDVAYHLPPRWVAIL
jgi:hypothetical protein